MRIPTTIALGLALTALAFAGPAAAGDGEYACTPDPTSEDTEAQACLVQGQVGDAPGCEDAGSHYYGTNGIDADLEASDQRVSAGAGGHERCAHGHDDYGGSQTYVVARHCNTDSYECQFVSVGWAEDAQDGSCNTYVYVDDGEERRSLTSDELGTEDEESCTQGPPPRAGWGTLFP